MRKVRKESELPSKENVLHLLHRSDTHCILPSPTQPVQISLLSLPSIRPLKKILQSVTPRVLTANSVPAEDRNEYFLLPEKATSPLKKRKVQRNTAGLTLIQCCLPTLVQLQSFCRSKSQPVNRNSFPNSSSSYLKPTLTGILPILHQPPLGALPGMLHPPWAPLLSIPASIPLLFVLHISRTL